MIIQCPKCSTRFSITEEAIANIVAPQFHCSRCSNYFTLAENAYENTSAQQSPAVTPQPQAVVDEPVANWETATNDNYPDEFEEFAVEKFSRLSTTDTATAPANKKRASGVEPQLIDSFFNADSDEESDEVAEQLALIDDDSDIETDLPEKPAEETFNFTSFSEEEEAEPAQFTAQWPGDESDAAEVWTQPVVAKKKWGGSATWTQTPPAQLEADEDWEEELVEEEENSQDEDDVKLTATEQDDDNATTSKFNSSFAQDDLEEEELEDEEDDELEDEEEFEEEEDEEYDEEEDDFDDEAVLKTISPQKLEEELYNFFPDQDNDAPDNFTATFGDFSDQAASNQQFGQVLDFPPAFQEPATPEKQVSAKSKERPLPATSRNNFSAIALVCSAPLLLLIALGVISNQSIDNSFALSQLRSIFEPNLPSTPPSGVEIIDLTSRIQPLNDGLRVIEISGSLYNATLETFRDVAIRAQVFSNENHFISEVIAPADNSLLNASIRTLDIQSLTELQQKPSSNEGLIRPNEKLPFKLILATTSGSETWFSTKVHSVLAATTERLLRD